MKVLFASQNKGKQNEARKLFDDLDISLLFPSDFPKLKDFDVDETGKTFIENAVLKAKTYAKKINIPCIADDSGVIIDAMDGLPGIHSNRWFDGTPDDRNQEVLKRLNSIEEAKRTARYLTAVCYYDPISEEYGVFTATQEGTIGNEIIGDEGFAYDRIFIPEGYNKTFAQLGDKLKNEMSQRARAFKKIKLLVDILTQKDE